MLAGRWRRSVARRPVAGRRIHAGVQVDRVRCRGQLARVLRTMGTSSLASLVCAKHEDAETSPGVVGESSASGIGGRQVMRTGRHEVDSFEWWEVWEVLVGAL